MLVLSWASLGLGVAGEAAVGVSLAFFDETRAGGRTSETMDARNVARVVQMLTVLHVVHAPHMAVFAVLGTAYALGRWRTLAAVVALYASTYVTRQKSLERGQRKWEQFQTWTLRTVEGAAKSWYGSVRVVHDGKVSEAAQSSPHVFAYHPHSMVPAGAVWFHMLPDFSARFRGIQPVTLAASVLFKAPIVRELAAWLGVRAVSREIFRSTLREQGAVVVCPGGQHEMQEHGGPMEETIVLCTKHKGFIRIAIEERARVVPVICFGESKSWTNIMAKPGRYLYRRFRFGFTPLLAVGYLGILPLPRRVPITFVIGEPMVLPDPDALTGLAKESDVDAFHATYYSQVERLFDEHKSKAGFPELCLVMKND